MLTLFIKLDLFQISDNLAAKYIENTMRL